MAEEQPLDAATAPAPGTPADPPAPAAPDATPGTKPVPLDSFSIDELLSQASFDDPSIFGGPGGAGGGGGGAPGSPASTADTSAAPAALADAGDFKLPSFQQAMQEAQASSIDLLRDVELNVKIELGRSRMMVEDVLKLAEGSVVELDKLAGDPVDVFVNDRLVARGEVLVLNDNFCVRVNEIVAGAKEEAM